MRAPQVAWFCSAAWPDFTPALTRAFGDLAKKGGLWAFGFMLIAHMSNHNWPSYSSEWFELYSISRKTRSEQMEITRSGSTPSVKGPSEWFTGTVRIDPMFAANDARRSSAATVTFEPGARTAWHTHPFGQTLIVTAGFGRVQREGGPVEDIRPGDVVWFPPGERHWHGASPTTAMSHIAIQEHLDGKVVDWMDHVTDSQYQG
jgi:quercetin dioxygenase-like cupin family protein